MIEWAGLPPLTLSSEAAASQPASQLASSPSNLQLRGTFSSSCRLDPLSFCPARPPFPPSLFFASFQLPTYPECRMQGVLLPYLHFKAS